MVNIKKVFVKILPLVLVISFTSGLIFFVQNQEVAEPKNPLNNPVEISEIQYSDITNNLVVSDNTLNSENTDLKQNSKKEISGSTESNLKSTEIPSQKASTEQSNRNSGNSYNQIKSNYVEIVTEKIKNSVQINNPDKERETLTENKEKEYFKTSIKNNETVKTLDYIFTITHLDKKLKVKSTNVYVNDTKIKQFNGKIRLKSGKNNIYISISYTDENNKLISVYKEYNIFADVGEITFFTDLANFTTGEKEIYFTAKAEVSSKEIPLTVQCNGLHILSESNQYKIQLKSGKNLIKLEAEKDGKNKTETYTIQCTASDKFEIYTTLENNKTVNSEDFNFTAYTLNGGKNIKFTVTFNDNIINGNREYSVKLNNGNNSIRIKATSIINNEKKTINQNYTIKYVPQSTPETAPYLDYSNVSDNMSVKGNVFTLNIKPVDYKGNKIYDSNTRVFLNNIQYSSSWVNEYIGYTLYLVNGSNGLNIRIIDNDGRYTDYYYTINCTHLNDGEKIGAVNFSFDANVLGLGYIIEPTECDIFQGETSAQFLDRVLTQNGFTYSNTGTLESGFYLSRISKEGIGSNINIPQELINKINSDGLSHNNQKYADSIGENDYYQGAGFMYCVNDSFPGISLSDIALQDGDTFKLRFTLAYGKDIGGYSDTSGNYNKVW